MRTDQYVGPHRQWVSLDATEDGVFHDYAPLPDYDRSAFRSYYGAVEHARFRTNPNVSRHDSSCSDSRGCMNIGPLPVMLK